MVLSSYSESLYISTHFSAKSQDPVTFDPTIGKSDARRPFKKQYSDMVKLFATHDKIVPVAFVDAMALLFSHNGWERRLRNIESIRQATFDPLGRSLLPWNQGFRLQIRLPPALHHPRRSCALIPKSKLVPLTGLIPAKYYIPRPADYNWKYNEMRFAILSARVVCLSNIRKLPLTCRWTYSLNAIKALQSRGSITSPPSTVLKRSPLDSCCLQSSSAQGKSENDGAQWDVNQL